MDLQQTLNPTFSLRRLLAMCRKETLQIIRDPSSIIMAFILPLLLLFIFAYGINLDSSKLRIGILPEQYSQPAKQLISTFSSSPYFTVRLATNRQQLSDWLQAGQIRGMIIIPGNFDRILINNQQQSPLQIITDGSEPNIANFMRNYGEGIWKQWYQQWQQDQGDGQFVPLTIESRYWFNSAVISRHFLVPGAITLIMTVIGSMLTSLIIAREWERGTVEYLLATALTKTEFLLGKVIPYYALAMTTQLLCFSIAVWWIGIPFRGSFLLFFIISSLFITSALGIGLLLSTLIKNQFNAAMMTLNVAFLPSMMLSGFIFEIESQPVIVQAITYIVPARYYVSTLQTLFLTGNVPSVLLTDFLFLGGFTLLLFAWIAFKTPRHLQE